MPSSNPLKKLQKFSPKKSYCQKTKKKETFSTFTTVHKSFWLITFLGGLFSNFLNRFELGKKFSVFLFAPI